MIIRALWFLGVLVSAAAGPLWFLCLVGVPYLLYYAGIELLFVALLVDGYFGFERTDWPLYTLVVLVLIIVVQFLRPYISVYNR